MQAEPRKAARPVAIVTGGSSGIGLASARLLAARGCLPVLIARGAERLEAARQGLAAAGHEAETHRLDVGDEAASRAVFGEIVARHGAPAWLVASAGIVEPGLFLDQDLAPHVAQMRTNYFGALHAVRAVAPAMAAARSGRIVLVSSGAGLFGVVGYGGYSPSKFAVRGLAEVLRIELAAHGVGVTVAFPPDTDTPQLAYETPLRPAATAAFAAGGGVWSAETIARAIIAGAEKGRFAVTPGWGLTAGAWLQGLAAPLLRARQLKLLRRNAK